MRFSAPRGTEDVLPSKSHAWQRIEAHFRDVTRVYGYQEIRTPVFEDTELFTRSAGETSEVVTKQMYDFLDKGGRSISLKPESTAPAMRAIIEHNLCVVGSSLRVCYVSSPHYRYERPQKGRLREHHQMGLELVGVESAAADAEVIEIGFRFLERIGLGGLVVKINSIGRDECRARYRDVILEAATSLFASKGAEFEETARKNPLRLLDSKDPEVQAAMATVPSILDYLEPASATRFQELQTLLKEANLPFEVSPEIVRGLDYYTETVFEVHSSDLGAQSTVMGGGRYDNLISELGGPKLPAVGFGSGVERLLLVLETLGKMPSPRVPDVFVVWAPEAQTYAHDLCRHVRAAGLEALIDLEGRSFKSQFRQADKSSAKWVAVLGPDEVSTQTVSLKDLLTGEQKTYSFEEAIKCIG
ncbi:MAG: histidine--tRNA ligase [Fimbriimonadaceae bacterium]